MCGWTCPRNDWAARLSIYGWQTGACVSRENRFVNETGTLFTKAWDEFAVEAIPCKRGAG